MLNLFCNIIVMNNPIELVRDALDYYDNNNLKYTNFMNTVRYIKAIPVKNSRVKLELYDSDNNFIITIEIESLGMYNNNTSTWIWAWAQSNYQKENIIISRKILNYGLDLEAQYRFLKTELITSRFRISTYVQSDVHIAIASYLAKKPFILDIYIYPENDKVQEYQMPKIDKPGYTRYCYFVINHDEVDEYIKKHNL